MTADHLNLQGGQLGDPVRGAGAIVSRVVGGAGPLRQLLGSDAYSYANAKLDALRADVDAAKDTAGDTDFSEA